MAASALEGVLLSRVANICAAYTLMHFSLLLYSFSQRGRTPLHQSSAHGHFATTQALIVAGADVSLKDKVIIICTLFDMFVF